MEIRENAAAALRMRIVIRNPPSLSRSRPELFVGFFYSRRESRVNDEVAYDRESISDASAIAMRVLYITQDTPRS
jgi:hypothetical protein